MDEYVPSITATSSASATLVVPRGGQLTPLISIFDSPRRYRLQIRNALIVPALSGSLAEDRREDGFAHVRVRTIDLVHAEGAPEEGCQGRHLRGKLMAMAIDGGKVGGSEHCCHWWDLNRKVTIGECLLTVLMSTRVCVLDGISHSNGLCRGNARMHKRRPALIAS